MSLYNIKRSICFFWQRLTRGWSDDATWNLDSRIAEWVLPRLKRFKEINRCYPNDLTPEQWDAILDEMIFAMEWTASDCSKRDESEETWKRVEAGTQLFGRFLHSLWW